jgi:peptide deformylase
MIKPLVIFPDERLTAACASVSVFDEELKSLVQDLFDTLYAGDGIGLAAPQIGVLKRVFVMDVRKGKKPFHPLVYVNPKVVCTTLQTSTAEEGCLSLPGVFLPVTRAARVGVSGRGVMGEYLQGELTGLEARCFAHECDHTQGILFTSRADMKK